MPLPGSGHMDVVLKRAVRYLPRMGSVPFDILPPHKPRRFVPEAIDLGDWAQISPLFERLEARSPKCIVPTDLESWLLDWSELSASLDEESARRYIAMTCDTEDREAEKTYLEFVQEIEPQVKPRQFKLAQLYVGHPLRLKLSKPRYKVFDRDTKAHV